MIGWSKKPLLLWHGSSCSNSFSLKPGIRSHHIVRGSDKRSSNLIVYDLHDTVIPYEEVCVYVCVWSFESKVVMLMIDPICFAGVDVAKISSG